ncbi:MULTISPECIES: AAA family ATPase [Methanobacterium]|jgi:MoxR-like ATPase|uniref:MoxR family ATPase n=1 Tax=Methanobacterium veterum TaxID=408577 RepID=A0A9E4ZZ75_9EURY|nr:MULTISPECIES: MoxR family ATPase [Methanobacterium]MCZ3366263.1 MoxR family ATPase [Methanobacterium veterum]MCZ3371509.1 MoxR family ATPase [Methanobacterium veterum]
MKDLNINSINESLIENKYIPDDKIGTIVFIALSLKKPILIEGPPGTGKTELAKALSRSLKRDFFRIQCYEGITFEQVVGEWNYQKQLLFLEMARIEKQSTEIFHEEFFIKRSLLSAFKNKNPSIILIDELDKADEEVESFLLQALAEKEITVNDLGTFNLENDLLMVITSNSQRKLLNETKDRCLHLYIDYPSSQREKEIVNMHLPEAPQETVSEIVNIMQRIRKLKLSKKPSIRATVDLVKTLIAMDKEELDNDSFEKTLGVILKDEEDKEKVQSFRYFSK